MRLGCDASQRLATYGPLQPAEDDVSWWEHPLVVVATAGLGEWSALVRALACLAAMYAVYFVMVLLSPSSIGFGDVKLGIALGLLLGDWQLAILALFLANFIGCLIVLPMMIAGKVTGQTQVPFGPLLIAGTVIAKLVGFYLIDWYLHLLF